MALSSMSVIGSSITNINSPGSSIYTNKQLTSPAFGTLNRTRTDATYGLITVSASATGGDNVNYGIGRMLDGLTDSTWSSLNSDYPNFYDESYTSVNYWSALTGGEYSDSGNTTYLRSSGSYYGYKNASQVYTRFTTNYTNDAQTAFTIYGSYVTVNFESNYKALLKSFTIGGYTSTNWDDIPRSIIIVGSDDNISWKLIKDASDFGSLSPWSSYIGVPSTYNGYKTSTGVSIPYKTYTYALTTTKKFRYLRFVFTNLVRGRVLAMTEFNLLYDIYVG